MREPLTSKSEPEGKRILSRRSAFVVATLLFLITNSLLLVARPLRFDNFAYPSRTWTYWSFYDIRNFTMQPDVVLLGSSLMVTAVSEADASFTQRRLDLCAYRSAAYFDHLLSTTAGGKPGTLNLSAPGQMPSDAYLTLKAALENGVKPRMLVYGLAPRDFIDGTLQNAFDTEAFQYLKRIVNIDEVASDIYRNPLARVDWQLHKGIYLYGQALDLKMVLGKALEEKLQRVFAFDAVKRPGLYIASLLPGYRAFDISPGSFIAAIPERDRKAFEFHDNLADYKCRYRKPDKAIYNMQMGFLKRLVSLCREHDIDVVLVNMPITQQNVALLPADTYNRYMDDLAALADGQSVDYLNQCRFEQYSQRDFRDSVHLNGFGGKKFVERLVASMCGNRHINSTLAAIGKGEGARSIAAGRAIKPQTGLQ